MPHQTLLLVTELPCLLRHWSIKAHPCQPVNSSLTSRLIEVQVVSPSHVDITARPPDLACSNLKIEFILQSIVTYSVYELMPIELCI
jgi:hypothetical protein